MNDWAGGKPFIVRGAHSVISACTLPPWTPSEVVDRMNTYFGMMLRQDLVDLREKINKSGPSEIIPRDRSASTGSFVLASCSPLKNVSQGDSDSEV